MSSPDNGWRELQKAAQVLQSMSIPFVVGGSLASSYHGQPRSTNDADVMVAPFAGREQEFADRFESYYYLSLPAMIEANRSRRSFNIINTTTGFKIDIFTQKNRPYDAAIFERKIAAQIDAVPFELPMLSPEDSILLKLEWYRLGHEASDRQWLDIRSVMQAKWGRLDLPYLQHWATDLKVDDLLERALNEATPEDTSLDEFP